MSDFNRVILLGRIGNDPELKYSAQEKPFLRLSIATNSWRPAAEGEAKGKDNRATHWHRVVVFGSQALVCATYLKKGSMVLVEGSLEVRSYTDKEGRKATSVSVIAYRVNFMGGRLAAEAKPELEPEAEVETMEYASAASA